MSICVECITGGCRVCVCSCVYGWVVTNNPPCTKLFSGSRIKPFKHYLIYSNCWEVLSVVPVSNEKERTNIWQGIFLLHSTAYNYRLTNWVWGTCMEQSAMNHKRQTTVMQLYPRLSYILCLYHERSNQIYVLYFHPVAKSRDEILRWRNQILFSNWYVVIINMLFQRLDCQQPTEFKNNS